MSSLGLADVEPDRARFESLVGDADSNGCRLFVGYIRPNGYGQMKVMGKNVKAHRLAWILAYDRIPAGLFVCHRCDVRACVEPEHLFLGTYLDNIRDMVAKGRNSPPPRLLGLRNPRGKLSDHDVADIRNRCAAGEGSRAIARRFGIWGTTVRMIASGKSHNHGGASLDAAAVDALRKCGAP